ncbi:hypothetical protein [Flavobacterium aquatile]|nr:hypothetical protein [Flavobacterium aquatile]GEC77582.1 hypothetical protein FAQ01_04520 [Flavobacterium aquatile]
MKIAKIDMSKVKSKNAFEDVKWKNATTSEAAKVYAAMARISTARKTKVA